MAYGMVIKFFTSVRPTVIGSVHMPSILFPTLSECRFAATNVAMSLDRQGAEGVVQCVALGAQDRPVPEDAFTEFHPK